MRKEDAQMEIAKLREWAANARECAQHADRTADMREGMERAAAMERRANELEELYVNDR